MLSVEKVYDELYGMIEDLKKKIAAMSSGDEVTITPALESGTKIADFTIGEDEGVLYAPNPYTPVSYSTDEQDTGKTWVDGRPLYQKTINFGALPNNTTKAVAHGISNLDRIVVMFGTAYNTDTGFTLPLEDTDGAIGITGVIRLFADDTNISIVTYRDQSMYDSTYVTIQYTKTPPEPEPEAKKTRKK